MLIPEFFGVSFPTLITTSPPECAGGGNQLQSMAGGMQFRRMPIGGHAATTWAQRHTSATDAGGGGGSHVGARMQGLETPLYWNYQ